MDIVSLRQVNNTSVQYSQLQQNVSYIRNTKVDINNDVIFVKIWEISAFFVLHRSHPCSYGVKTSEQAKM